MTNARGLNEIHSNREAMSSADGVTEVYDALTLGYGNNYKTGDPDGSFLENIVSQSRRSKLGLSESGGEGGFESG